MSLSVPERWKVMRNKYLKGGDIDEAEISYFIKEDFVPKHEVTSATFHVAVNMIDSKFYKYEYKEFYVNREETFMIKYLMRYLQMKLENKSFLNRKICLEKLQNEARKWWI